MHGYILEWFDVIHLILNALSLKLLWICSVTTVLLITEFEMWIKIIVGVILILEYREYIPPLPSPSDKKRKMRPILNGPISYRSRFHWTLLEVRGGTLNCHCFKCCLVMCSPPWLRRCHLKAATELTPTVSTNLHYLINLALNIVMETTFLYSLIIFFLMKTS